MFIVAATAGDNALGGPLQQGADDPVLNKVNWADPDPGLATENMMVSSPSHTEVESSIEFGLVNGIHLFFQQKPRALISSSPLLTGTNE